MHVDPPSEELGEMVLHLLRPMPRKSLYWLPGKTVIDHDLSLEYDKGQTMEDVLEW